MEHPHLMNTVAYRDSTIVNGVGSRLITSDGRKLLDFFTDTGTACLGYSSPEIGAAVRRLMEVPLHAPNLYPYDERDKAAARLTKATGMDKVFFCNSGTEAVEAAIKLGRKAQYENGRSDIWSYKGGFHGRTYAAMAATDSAPYHKHGFGPHLYGFHKFDTIMDIGHDAAMVILAPVMGNNDVIPYPVGWLRELRECTRKYGILLAFDEVQTGSGRTGNWTYAQEAGVTPDIICLAKGLGMGAPVGACLSTDAVAQHFTPGVHFSTFGGNPISCVFVNAMLDWLTPVRCEEIKSKGAYIKRRLEMLGWAKNIRGAGLMIAFDTLMDAKQFSLVAEKKGLILGAWRSNPIKLTPPLNVSFSDIDEAIEMMDETRRDMSKDDE